MRAQIPYNCQSNTTTVVQYNETFAKKIALPMMAASAAPDHQAVRFEIDAANYKASLKVAATCRNKSCCFIAPWIARDASRSNYLLVVFDHFSPASGNISRVLAAMHMLLATLRKFLAEVRPT